MAKTQRQRSRGVERRSKPAAARGPAVSAEERRTLATCCAFFTAEQYRQAGPDSLRESDIDIAEEAISEAIQTRCAPRRRAPRKPK